MSHRYIACAADAEAVIGDWWLVAGGTGRAAWPSSADPGHQPQTTSHKPPGRGLRL